LPLQLTAAALLDEQVTRRHAGRRHTCRPQAGNAAAA